MIEGPGPYEMVRRRFQVGDPGPGGWGGSLSEAEGEDFESVEEAFGHLLDESLAPRGPASLFDLVAATGLSSPGTAVDVGCGSAADAVELVRRFGLHVHGVDPNPANLERARVRLQDEHLEEEVDLHIGRAEAIPLPSQSCDLLWCKEVLTFTDLEATMAEFGRVLRPGGTGVVYQVLTGPAMGDEEAAWFFSQEMGFGPARIVRPAVVETAIAEAGLVLRERVDFGSEWGEAAQETDQGPGRRLVHTARLLRQPDRYISAFGEANYRIMLGDCLWHVYRMIGKLWGAAFVIAHP